MRHKGKDPPIPDSANLKQCAHCGRFKVISLDKNESQFYILRRKGYTRKYFHTYCIQCSRIRQACYESRIPLSKRREARKRKNRRYMFKHKDKRKEFQIAYRATLMGKLVRNRSNQRMLLKRATTPERRQQLEAQIAASTREIERVKQQRGQVQGMVDSP